MAIFGLGIFLLLAAGPAAPVAEQPDDFAFGLALQAPGNEALYQVEIPAAIYQGAVRGDLGDVRVFNGAGEVVPHALKPREAMSTCPEEAVPLPLFPIRAAPTQTVEGMRLTVTRRADGTIVRVTPERQPPTAGKVVAYLLDASQTASPLKSLELDWQDPDGGYFGTIRIEGSEDLAQWTTLAPYAPLVRMESRGQRLERRTIDLPTGTRKYLRVSWPAGRTVLALTAARAFPADATVEPARAWKEVTGKLQTGKPGEYEFDVGGLFPADRLRLLLPQRNTVATVQVLTRTSPTEEWRSALRAAVYRLHQAEGEVMNPDLAMSPTRTRYWLVRVDPRGGGTGQGELRLALGWVPEQLVFAARGNGPFLLAYGNRRAQPAGHPIETLVPGYRTDRALRAVAAQVGQEKELGGPRRLKEAVDYTRWLLWGGLILGVLVLAGMAYRLWRQMQPTQTSG